MPDFSKLCCPVCKDKLEIGDDLQCLKCRKIYPIINDIPIMLTGGQEVNNDQDVFEEKEFYEKMFSNLKGLEDGHCIVYGYENIYKAFDVVEPSSVLEPGCGTGHHSAYLAGKGFDVTGMDLSLNGLKAARKLAKHEGHDILFICGDMFKLPFEENAFNVCFCSLILHHFTDLDVIIKELARVTKNYFIAYEVNGLDPISYIRFNMINPMFGIKNISKNQRAIFPDRLRNLLRKNGFKNITLSFEDVHEYIGKDPVGYKARMIKGYKNIMRLFPIKFSSNKFLIFGKK